MMQKRVSGLGKCGGHLNHLDFCEIAKMCEKYVLRFRRNRYFQLANAKTTKNTLQHIAEALPVITYFYVKRK